MSSVQKNSNRHFFDVFRRKKDHGRAEALLIAAWGLGFRRTKPDEEAVAAEEEEAFSDNNQDIVAN